jgi:hypothetical protein
MGPLLVAPGALLFAMISLPVGFLLAVVSLFNWKLMVWGGGMSILSGMFWLEGLNIVQPQVVRGLNAWYGYHGGTITSTVWAQAGPYVAVVGGVILLAGYALSKMEKLEYPID